MKNLTERFLSNIDRQRIEKTVAAAEQKTSGEVVCMIVSSSYHYAMAGITGATAFALPAGLLATHFLGGWMWIGTQNMWLFIGLFAILFSMMLWILKHIPSLKRLFISKREIDEEVEEAAITAFFKQGLYRTRDANGVLLFISVFEQKIWLLADKGIHEKVPSGQWENLIAHITQGILKGHRVDAICSAIDNIGDLLQSHFPIKSDDTDELKNLIIEDA